MLVQELALLIEARRNPNLNPKVDTTEYLRTKYGNFPKNIFVNFSDVNKVGIHPSSSYNTPNGFYCYPLEYILNLPRGTYDKPFPLNKTKYCTIVKLVDSTNVFDIEDALSDEMQEKINDLSGKYHIIVNPYDLSVANIWKQIYKKLYHEYPDNFDYNPEYNHQPSQMARNALKYFRLLGIDGITDLDDTGTIHENEPTQAVFFNMRCLKHLETIVYERFPPDEYETQKQQINQIKSTTQLTNFLAHIQKTNLSMYNLIQPNLIQHAILNMAQSQQQTLDLLDTLYTFDPLIPLFHPLNLICIINIIKQKYKILNPSLITNTPLTKNILQQF